MKQSTTYLIRLALLVALLLGFHQGALAQGTFDIRAVHMVEGGPNVDIHFNDMVSPTIPNLAYEYVSQRVSGLPVGTGSLNVKVGPVGGGIAGALISQNITVAGATEYTGVVFMADAQPRLKMLDRPKAKLPKPGQALLRVLNISGGDNPAAFDFYLDSTGGEPRFAAISREQVSSFADVKGEPSTLYITPSGSKTPVAQMIVPLTAGSYITLIVSGANSTELKVHVLNGENIATYKLPILEGVEGGMLPSVRVVHAWWQKTPQGKLQPLDIFLDDLPKVTGLKYRVASEKYGPLTGDTATIKFALANEGAGSAIFTQIIPLNRDSDYVSILTKTSEGAAAALLLSAPNSIPTSFVDSFGIRAAYLTDFHKNITIKVISNGAEDTLTMPALSFLTASGWYSIMRGPFTVEAYAPGSTTPFYTKPHHGAFASTYLTVIVIGSDSTFEIDVLNEMLPVIQVFDPSASVPAGPLAGTTPMELRSFPNPSTGRMNVSFTLPSTGHVTLHLFDNMGRRVATLLDESREAGEQSIAVDAADLPAGLYLYKLRTESGENGVGRMVIVE